jgi:hypothetical protein
MLVSSLQCTHCDTPTSHHFRPQSTFEDKEHVHLCMEVCAGGELFDSIVESGNFSEKKAAQARVAFLLNGCGRWDRRNSWCCVRSDLAWLWAPLRFSVLTPSNASRAQDLYERNCINTATARLHASE